MLGRTLTGGLFRGFTGVGPLMSGGLTSGGGIGRGANPIGGLAAGTAFF